MKPKLVKIESIKRQTENQFIIRINKPMKHDPGQFLEVSLFGIGEAPISICSHNDKYFEMSFTDVGNVTHQMSKLKKGDEIGIRGPFGKGYPMHYFKGNELIVIGGGCGIAPVKGVLDYVESHPGEFKDVHIFFGCKEPKSILFEDDIKRYHKKFNTKITVDKGDETWKGDVGLVTKILEESKLNNTNKIAIVCGPPIMMKFVIQTLKKMGFHDDQIFLSLERHMKCGIQKCGHCMVNGIYVCQDGPVFRYDKVVGLSEKW